MPILNITSQALTRLKQLLNRQQAFGMRVAVKSGGCSGITYVIDYTDKQNAGDELIELDDCRVILDKDAILYVIGSQMDYVEDKFKSGFVFSNPNAKGVCGCGESFNA